MMQQNSSFGNIHFIHVSGDKHKLSVYCKLRIHIVLHTVFMSHPAFARGKYRRACDNNLCQCNGSKRQRRASPVLRGGGSSARIDFECTLRKGQMNALV